MVALGSQHASRITRTQETLSSDRLRVFKKDIGVFLNKPVKAVP